MATAGKLYTADFETGSHKIRASLLCIVPLSLCLIGNVRSCKHDRLACLIIVSDTGVQFHNWIGPIGLYSADSILKLVTTHLYTAIDWYILLLGRQCAIWSFWVINLSNIKPYTVVTPKREIARKMGEYNKEKCCAKQRRVKGCWRSLHLIVDSEWP